MKNRLYLKTQEVRKNKSKLFCAFLTLGYPNLQATEKLVLEFEKAGADIIELGFPFSDPMADGPTIQFSSEQALKNGISIKDSFKLVERLRKKGCRIPIIFFTYLNPIYHYGLKAFVQSAKAAGFDGLIVPDLPPEEEYELNAACRRHNFPQIYLVAPTTEKNRADHIARASQGFIYYVSLKGVTGARKSLSTDIQKNLNQLKRVTQKPILIGFGVSSPDQGKKLAGLSDGVIVGSAIVNELRKNHGAIAPAVRFVRRMVRSVKS